MSSGLFENEAGSGILQSMADRVMPVEMPGLEVRGLVYSYRRKATALRGLDLSIHGSDKIVGLFGPNGAGKTTLLRCVAGLINRYSGEIRVTGSGGIAFLPDVAIYCGFLSLRECIRLTYRLDDTTDVGLAEAALETLGLDLDLKVRELSKGMGEQLHLALLLARGASLFLLDEPLASVDPLTREKLVEMVLRRANADRSLVVISTHLISGLEEIFDEIVVVDNGAVLTHVEANSVGGDLEAYVKEVMRAEHGLV